ncbi:hypothetical protein [Miltoncostaea marina]|uniref:hypothetical protein n=1 Tax=Miltoncostaea marina TaxID=2843215 RepID=UPI001C3C6AE8|nr:hypothetical protein [Miltoncostaea marina]
MSMLRDDDATPNDLQRALLEYDPTTLETALIEWTKEHWPMAARAMVYNRAEADKTVEGVPGIRNDDARLALEVAARVAISERELLCRGIAAVLPQWLESTYGLTPKAKS